LARLTPALAVQPGSQQALGSFLPHLKERYSKKESNNPADNWLLVGPGKRVTSGNQRCSFSLLSFQDENNEKRKQETKKRKGGAWRGVRQRYRVHSVRPLEPPWSGVSVRTQGFSLCQDSLTLYSFTFSG